MDYKEVLEQLRDIILHGDEHPAEYCTNRCGGCDACDKAIEAIETLLAERDAAVADIPIRCYKCKYYDIPDKEPPCGECIELGGSENNWQWRGPQKGNDET